MARPTKYDEVKAEKIARFIFEGLTIKDACYGVGISDDTFRRWRDKYPDFNKKIVEATNRQWESSEAIAKYHQGYRGYKRPKIALSPNYGKKTHTLLFDEKKPLTGLLNRSQPQFYLGLPVRYQRPEELVPTPKYYNATTDRVEWIDTKCYGRPIFSSCSPEVYRRKLQEKALRAAMDDWFVVI